METIKLYLKKIQYWFTEKWTSGEAHDMFIIAVIGILSLTLGLILFF